MSCRHKWLTFAQVIHLYAGCEATAKAVCMAAPSRPHPEAPKEDAAKQHYVLEYDCTTKEDEVKEHMEGKVAGLVDKGTLEALVEHSAFSAENVGNEGSSLRRRKKPKQERVETDCEKAKAMRAKISRLGPARAGCACMRMPLQ